MKLFLLIFVIALAIQGSVAGPISRRKRNDEFVKEFEEAIQIAKRIVPAAGEAVSKALDKLPKTDAYEKYRQDLQGFLDEVHRYKTVKGNCMEKTLATITIISDLIDEYEKEDAPAEAKEVDRLIDEQGGEVLEKDAGELSAKMSSPTFAEGLENMDDMDSLRIAAIVIEEC